MPQLVLEYSSNVIEKDDLTKLLKKINHFLTDSLPADLAACKGRAFERDVYCVSDGDARHAFVHVHLKVMAGRTYEKLNDVGNGLMSLLQEYFQTSAKQLALQMSLEIQELQKTYFKI
ncbi:MAG: 5-carboxymethyl-2-hydroxymuconate Delta-isomerase [Gammaproteobacteria bacterium]